jgi:hypothetical protein
MQQSQLTDILLNITNLTPSNPTYPLTFVSAKSTVSQGVISNLLIEPLNERPNCARIKADITIPVSVAYTDANGVEGTHPVSFPYYIQDGKTIECQQFTIKCPKGWENIGNFKIMLKNVDKGLQIDYSYLQPDVEAGEGKITVDGEMEKLEALFGSASVTRTKTQVGGRDAEKLVVNMIGDAPAYMEVYCVEVGDGLMTFNCTYADPADKDTFDFKSILDTIEYRI